MLAILYHSFYKWEFRGVAPQQGFHSACYRFRHTLKGGTVSLSGNTEWKPCSGATPVNENLSVRLKALQLYIYWSALKGLNYIA